VSSASMLLWSRSQLAVDTPYLPAFWAENATVALSEIKIGDIGALPAIGTSLFLLQKFGRTGRISRSGGSL
jgi:hypothetical protein